MAMHTYSPAERQKAKKMVFLVGLLFLVFGIGGSFFHKTRITGLPTTQARVLQVKSKGEAYTAVEYQVNGKKYSHNFNTENAKYCRKGQSVTIAYNPNNPNQAYWTSFKADYGTSLVGLLLLLLSGYPQNWIRSRRKV